MAAIRGAICAENNAVSIGEAAVRLVGEILQKNDLPTDEVETIFFTVTRDLDAAYPAAAVRKHFGFSNAAFMCMQEQFVEGSLPRCIRVCVLTSKPYQKEVKHCYVGAAAVLRTDLREVEQN